MLNSGVGNDHLEGLDDDDVLIGGLGHDVFDGGAYLAGSDASALARPALSTFCFRRFRRQTT